MSTYSVYFSPTRGTKKVTNFLAEGMGTFEEIDLCRPVSEKRSFLKEDICFVGVPSYGGRVPEIALERMANFEGNGAQAVPVIVYGNRAYEDTMVELYDALKERGFFCAAAVSAVAEHSIMRQFASGRPDEEDLKELAEFRKKIREKLENRTEEEISVPGNRPYKELKVVPMVPETRGICNDCGLCVKSCPVCAISSGRPGETDVESCISCMRCIQICPSHARSLNPEMLSALSEKMAPLFKERKKNELFL